MEVHAVKTWFDSRHGLVTVQDDVLGVVRDIKAIDDRLTVYYNEQSDGYDIVESCLDGTDRLVFSVTELDARVVNRLRAADHWRGRRDPNHVLGDYEDFLTAIEEDNEAWHGERTEGFRDLLRDAGEKIAYHLDLPLKGNVGPKEQIFVGRNPLAEADQSPDPPGAS